MWLNLIKQKPTSFLGMFSTTTNYIWRLNMQRKTRKKTITRRIKRKFTSMEKSFFGKRNNFLVGHLRNTTNLLRWSCGQLMEHSTYNIKIFYIYIIVRPQNKTVLMNTIQRCVPCLTLNQIMFILISCIQKTHNPTKRTALDQALIPQRYHFIGFVFYLATAIKGISKYWLI